MSSANFWVLEGSVTGCQTPTKKRNSLMTSVVLVACPVRPSARPSTNKIQMRAKTVCLSIANLLVVLWRRFKANGGPLPSVPLLSKVVPGQCQRWDLRVDYRSTFSLASENVFCNGDDVAVGFPRWVRHAVRVDLYGDRDMLLGKIFHFGKVAGEPAPMAVSLAEFRLTNLHT